jgi:hypothetical protein
MSRSRAGLGLCVVAVLSAAVLVAPGIVQAHKKSYPATVNVSVQNKNVIEGQVHSVPRCLALRSVGVYSSAGVLETTAVTDAQGKFRITDPQLAADTHTVTVRRKVIRKSKHHKHVCLAASDSVTTTA